MSGERQLEWDEENIRHIARHDVAPGEVEEAFANNPLTLAVQIRNGEERVLCAGLTASGRPLQFVYTLRRGRIRVITAHTAKQRLRNRLVSVSKKKRKPAIRIDTPEFRSEAEEVAWWDAHQDMIADMLLKHGRRGAVPTQSISVRLPVPDIERARKLAERRGMGYQTLLKTLLHDALKREAKKAS